MKKFFAFFLLTSLMLSCLILLLNRPLFYSGADRKSLQPEKENELPPTMALPYLADLQYMKLRNPLTGEIPSGIRGRELEYASGLPVKESGRSQNWNWRGPANIGGRMLCIAVDIDDENHLLSGSASGGIWQSHNKGLTWSKATSPDDEQSATCIAQDPRPGKHNIWYYGTGELLSTTNRNISTNVRTIGIGNGIFKSTDNGETWQPLAFTQVGSPDMLTEVFQGIWRIAIDPLATGQDIVYAACYGAIMRSEDGGQTWQMVLGDLANKSFGTDIAITTDGVIYTLLGGYGWGLEPPGKAGIWRSTNGLQWTKITPAGFPDDNRASRLVIAPSNEKIVYIFTESQNPDLNPFNGYTNSLNTLWKMTWDTAGDSALWEDRTAGTPGQGSGSMNEWPYSFVCYGGYCLTMAVKPDNENVVFLGGMQLYRSENGFADSTQTIYMGGYPYDMDSTHQLHPDLHGLAFPPSDPDFLYVACDGGIHITCDCMASSDNMYWERKNYQLITTQFYSVTIDHGSSGNDWILGGLQDNNWYYTVTDNPAELWFDINICYDGFASCVAPDWEYSIISAYSGNIWTCRFDQDMHAIDIFAQLPDTLLKFYDPVMGSNSLFPFYQNFALDPNNYETFYLPTVTSIWRKDNLKAAAYDSSLRNTGWSHLSNVDVGDASEISFITVSRNPANRVYYGTNLGKVYRLDNANTGNPGPVNISGDSFPYNAFVAYIDVDEDNADNIILVFSNYEVQSIFSSGDGGATWTPQGGNLEEHPDGSGAGPSVRCVKFLNHENSKVWFAGTSAGLYSASELKGDSTNWKREGAESIGSVIIDMIDARQTDGFIAVATHGNGIYSTSYDPSLVIHEIPGISGLEIGNPYPNPARQSVTVDIVSDCSRPLEIALFDQSGRKLDVLYRQIITKGEKSIKLDLGGLNAGIYLLLFQSGEVKLSRKVMILE